MPAFNLPTTLRVTRQTGAKSAARGSHALHLHHDWVASSTVVISAHGEIDASNAHDLIVFVRYAIGPYRGLVLDLQGVTFFGTDGYSALCSIGQASSLASRVAVLPSPVVVRLLRICAPVPTVPVADDLDAALVAVQSNRPFIQLVSEARP